MFKVDASITFTPTEESSEVPLFSCAVRAGFPSPCEDHIQERLDLLKMLIPRPSSTYFVRAEGESMVQHGIHSGSILVVDRSLREKHGDIVIAAVDGELTCKLLDKKGRQLVSGSDTYPSIPIGEESDLVIEGVVRASIRIFRT